MTEAVGAHAQRHHQPVGDGHVAIVDEAPLQLEAVDEGAGRHYDAVPALDVVCEDVAEGDGVGELGRVARVVLRPHEHGVVVLELAQRGRERGDVEGVDAMELTRAEQRVGNRLVDEGIGGCPEHGDVLGLGRSVGRHHDDRQDPEQRVG